MKHKIGFSFEFFTFLHECKFSKCDDLRDLVPSVQFENDP